MNLRLKLTYLSLDVFFRKAKSNDTSLLLLGILLAGMWSSCYVQPREELRAHSFSIDILVPAQLTIPASVQRIALVTDCPECDSTDRAFVQKSAGGLQYLLTQSGRFEIVPITQADLFVHDSLNLNARVFSDNEVDALIVPEVTNSEFIVQNKFIRQGYAYGTAPRGGYQYCRTSLDVGIKTNWLLALPDTLALLDEYSFDYRKTYKVDAKTDRDAAAKLPAKDSILTYAAAVSAAMYSKRIAPFWMPRKRVYYSSANAKMQDALKAMQQDKPDEAIAAWSDLLSTTNSIRLKAYCYYNIAVAYELKDDLKKAFEYTQKSYAVYHLDEVDQYLNELKKRLAYEAKLSKQAGK